jgi:hypothetical protein
MYQVAAGPGRVVGVFTSVENAVLWLTKRAANE